MTTRMFGSGATSGRLISAKDQIESSELSAKITTDHLEAMGKAREESVQRMMAAGVYVALRKTMPSWENGSKKTRKLVSELKRIADELDFND